MTRSVHKTDIPLGAKITDYVNGAYFADAWTGTASQTDLTALGQYIKAARAAPWWVDAFMKLRNIVVGLFGLKDLGGMRDLDPNKSESDYKVGDRIGIFTLFDITPNEILLGDDDKHLKVVLSVYRNKQDNGQEQLTVTTVVHVHNLLGKLYMLPVTPMHRLIAPAVASAFVK